MPKMFIVFAILGMSSYAQELTVTQVSKLKNYNHSLWGKIRHQRLLKQIAIVQKDEAYLLAKRVCQSEPYGAKLSVRAKRLFYTVRTDRGDIKIDALDGEIMKECTK